MEKQRESESISEEIKVSDNVNGFKTPIPRKHYFSQRKAKKRASLSSSQVKFIGWRAPLKGFKTWVDSLRPKYQSVWDQSGIHEAITFSAEKTTTRTENDKLSILALSELWNPETNTFVFPWGESTVTLTDMSVMFGLSVTGESVSGQNDDGVDMELIMGLKSSSGTAVTGRAWLTRFKGTGSPVEHEAFLSLWLIQHVFPRSHYFIRRRHIFAAAARLARGIRVDLAGPVLAELYRDLRALRLRDGGPVRVTAPFQLLHFWASRRGLFGSPGKAFVWCPFSSAHEAVEPIAHTLRSVQLMGLDGSKELYSPHRVPKQFGLKCHVAIPGSATWVRRARDTVRRPRRSFVVSNEVEGKRIFGGAIEAEEMERDCVLKYCAVEIDKDCGNEDNNDASYSSSEKVLNGSTEKICIDKEEEDDDDIVVVVESGTGLNNNDNVEEIEKDCGVRDFDSSERYGSVKNDDIKADEFDRLVERISRLERVVREFKRRR